MVWGLLFVINVKAQIPEGYVKGSILLADESIVDGFIQDNMKKKAAVLFINQSGESRRTYYGTDVNGVIIDSINYMAVKGDFFKIVCRGKMSFLQKASHAAGKMIYNGSEAIMMPGTNGKIGDYFLYIDKQLTLINKNTVDGLVTTKFSNCTPASEKAKTINGNIPALAEAVSIYNSLNK